MADNLLWAVVGAGIGFAAGWSLRTMRYARRAAADARHIRREVDDMTHHDDDTGRTTWQTIALGVVVLLAAVSTVLAGVAARESNQANDRVTQIATCTQDILERTILAINERTAFSDEQANARRSVLVTQRRLVSALLDPEAPDDKQVRLAREYRQAVSAQLRYDDRNDERRADYPYPTPEQIRECE